MDLCKLKSMHNTQLRLPALVYDLLHYMVLKMAVGEVSAANTETSGRLHQLTRFHTELPTLLTRSAQTKLESFWWGLNLGAGRDG